ncbi:hypothetical protein [Spiroplasma citri]|uniref:hypothetical protein n=1 Tax=Spiroplasma citri TaxID=2133 RepID=UPI001EF93BBD|nr:hypothetical protein [Spiroplasma citri]
MVHTNSNFIVTPRTQVTIGYGSSNINIWGMVFKSLFTNYARTFKLLKKRLPTSISNLPDLVVNNDGNVKVNGE